MSISMKLTRAALNATKRFLPKEIRPENVRGVTNKLAYGKWVVGKGITLREQVAQDTVPPMEIAHSKQAEYAILYLHGGGYFFGKPSFYRLMMRVLLKHAPADLYFPEYRLAPEHPYPAAFDDGLASYRHLLDSGVDVRKWIVMGDSAGGGLSLAVLQAARDEGLPMPAAVVLFSPWTDLSGTSQSMCECTKTDVMFCQEWFALAAQWYVGAQDVCQSTISPLFGDMHGLPPTLIFASNHEMLRDDSTRLFEKMQAAHVPVQLISRDHMPHIWPVLAHTPEARQALIQAAEFIRQTVAIHQQNHQGAA